MAAMANRSNRECAHQALPKADEARVGDVKKLVEHVLTTFSNFPEETLADMWRTKSPTCGAQSPGCYYVLAAYASDGGNEYKLLRSNRSPHDDHSTSTTTWLSLKLPLPTYLHKKTLINICYIGNPE
jgi:hypothetical protein